MQNKLERDQQLAEARAEQAEMRRQQLLEREMERQMERNAGYGE